MELSFYFILNLILFILISGIFGIWVFFGLSLRKSFRFSPTLSNDRLYFGDRYKLKKNKSNEIDIGFKADDDTGLSYYRNVKDDNYAKPLISIIVPARNEEKYLANCIDSILSQNFENFELILINDNSNDSTLKIMQEYARKHKKIKIIDLTDKPNNWAGKNWACYNGFKQSSGVFLFFTDADTRHSTDVLMLSINRIKHEQLDALTLMPRLVSTDFLSKITLPLFSIFMHTRYSPLNVNNIKNKIGYFFGSFFIIHRNVYQLVGTHEGVKSEIIEDGALGKKVKEMGFKMKMFRGEDLVDAIWARNAKNLLVAINRLIIPFYKEDKKNALLITVALFFIFLFPLLLLFYSSYLFYTFNGMDNSMLFITNLLTIFMLFLISGIQSKFALLQNPSYCIGSPIGAVLITFGFIIGVIKSRINAEVIWRDRKYKLKS